MSNTSRHFFFVFLIFCFDIFVNTSLVISQEPHAFAIGPEVYHLNKTKVGGSWQKGTIVGGRANYDYIKRYNIYWGAQIFYASGTINGKSTNGSDIRSQWSDAQIEGNIGYTFQYKECPHYSFTPFIGVGYFQEVNKFQSPSPLHVKFNTYFGYASYGFLSNMNITDELEIGFNARFRTPWEPRCKITNDPELDNLTQIVGTGFQYRLELPITYNLACICQQLFLRVTPFFEQREYGHSFNFPFDFTKTKITLIGGNIQAGYAF